MTLLQDTAKPLAVDSAAVAEYVDMGLALEAARRAATARADGAVATCRMALSHTAGWMRIMAAALPSLGVVGYKEFHLAGGNAVRYAVHLFALDDGRPLGVVDAALVTPLRTAAAAAVASEWYFGADTPVRLGVVGSGTEAHAGVRALNAVLRLTEVRVTSRNAVNRERLARELRDELALPAHAAATVGDTTTGVDMVYVATNSEGQVVIGLDQLDGVPFLASIGSTVPAQRELDDAVLAKAEQVIVDTWDVLDESGDAIAAGAHGLDRRRVCLLGELSSRSADGLRRGFTVYKSIGSPEQDLVLASAILDAAGERGFGRPLAPLSSIKPNL